MNKDKDYFINAYHFIPLPKQKATANSKGEPLFTGRLEYRLTTKTPLFIPNTSNDHTFTPKEGWTEEHISYDFFSYHSLSKGQYYDDVYFEPIVQGSEVRGMLRSVYETITDSCLSAI
ncbi:MAG: RAMP superfamily CRISPR-associated protein, partial [Lachnospiraceae bacterium]